jgi:2-iminobutanoate/2-iminopropanoate deaminase
MKIAFIFLSLCLTATSAIAQTPEFVKPKTGTSPYSAAVKANGFLFIAGQIGVTENSKGKDLKAEVDVIFQKIKAILEEQHLTMSDIVTVTVYLKDINDYPAFNDIYRQYFKDNYPSRTAIAVAGIPFNANVEITATAAISEK